MLPIGKDTEFIVVECHVPVGLFESMKGLLAKGVIERAIKGRDNIWQIHGPPSFVFDLAVGFTKSASSN